MNAGTYEGSLFFCLFLNLFVLTLTQDIVDWWKKYFKDCLNPTDVPSTVEAGPRDSATGSRISGVKVAEVVKKHFKGRVPGVDGFCLEFLKVLESRCCRTVVVDTTLQHRIDIEGSAAGLAEWSGVPSF